MVYDAISQTDLEVISHASDSVASSPSPQTTSQQNGFQRVSTDAGADQETNGYFQTARADGNISMGDLVSMIRSMSSASYDMVDNEDEDNGDGGDYGGGSDNEEEATRPKANSPRRAPPPIDTAAAVASNKQPQSAPVGASSEDEPALRSPISDRPVPLSHPTPNLQSLQGAYLGNVERLERSAERMSSSSTDIASEIRKLDLEQKRRNSSLSVANELSPTSTHQSLRDSIRSITGASASRLAQVSEHRHEGGESSQPVLSVPVIVQPPPHIPLDHDQLQAGYHDIERVASATSNDTYEQARVLFSNFDGVHYAPPDETQGPERQAAVAKSLAQQSSSYRTDKMVYYPAPIPTALNLPPRLSENAAGESQNPGNKLSVPGLSERPATAREIETALSSPVEILDRILDESTHAPVPAFSGRFYSNPEVYGNLSYGKSSQDISEQKKKRGSGMFRFYKRSGSPNNQLDPAYRPGLLPVSEAQAAREHEGEGLQGATTGEQEEEEEKEDFKDVVDHTEDDLRDYTGPPNSLVAELEERKDELKHRTRTANTTGMRSTLLQLDAVAQRQSENRRQRPVTMMANPSMPNIDDIEDEMPLGFMFPEKPHIPADNRPLGLLDKRQFEEDEPLSKRRARLQEQQDADLASEPNPSPEPVGRSQELPSTIYLPGIDDPINSDNEEETLAQRIKRLKDKNRNSVAAGSDFTTEVLAEIDQSKGNNKQDDSDSEAGETLAQLRSRLQQDQDSKPQQSRYAKIPRARRSTGNVSLMQPARPVSYAPGSSHGSRTSLHQMPGQSQYVGYPMGKRNSYGYGMARPNTFYSGAGAAASGGMNQGGGGGVRVNATPRYYSKTVDNLPAMAMSTEKKQRDSIDRWRQSVV